MWINIYRSKKTLSEKMIGNTLLYAILTFGNLPLKLKLALLVMGDTALFFPEAYNVPVLLVCDLAVI